MKKHLASILAEEEDFEILTRAKANFQKVMGSDAVPTFKNGALFYLVLTDLAEKLSIITQNGSSINLSVTEFV